MSFTIHSLLDSINFGDGSRALEIVVSTGTQRVRVPVDAEQAEFLLALRNAATKATTETKMAKGAVVERNTSVGTTVDDDDAPTPIRMAAPATDEDDDL